MSGLTLGWLEHPSLLIFAKRLCAIQIITSLDKFDKYGNFNFILFINS